MSDVKKNDTNKNAEYAKGVMDFIEWLLSNDKYNACEINTGNNTIDKNIGLIADRWHVGKGELFREFMTNRNNG